MFSLNDKSLYNFHCMLKLEQFRTLVSRTAELRVKVKIIVEKFLLDGCVCVPLSHPVGCAWACVCVLT